MPALAASALMLAGTAPPGVLDVSVEGLRNHAGVVRLCLTQDPKTFPDCTDDSAARRLSMPASATGPVVFGDLPSGEYAISAFHDENGNARLDTFARIPREGFAFSRNPALRFGPPRFADAAFAVTAAPLHQSIRMRYIL